MLAFTYSRKTADEAHQYGYARAENVAAPVAATLFIPFTSVQLYEEAFSQLVGQPLKKIRWSSLLKSKKMVEAGLITE